MSQLVPCPDCGHLNPAGAESCESCNFPLREAADSPPQAPPPSAPEAGSGIPRHPLRRPSRRPGPLPAQSLWLWLLFGVFMAGYVIYTAVKANVDRNANAQVEGSNEAQQRGAERALAALAKDSTNVDAHVALGDVLYDTGNWSEAIVHYKAVVRRDSSRVNALVDMGVCYYNLGDSVEAERLFRLALARDPHQPVALFNLGIVSERKGNYEDALQFYHRALETGPNDEIKNAIVSAIQRMAEKTGKQPKPLPGVGGNS